MRKLIVVPLTHTPFLLQYPCPLCAILHVNALLKVIYQYLANRQNQYINILTAVELNAASQHSPNTLPQPPLGRSSDQGMLFRQL